jgi:hypothetical protein
MARDFKTAPSINGNAIIPTGGGSGAVLLKSSATDYNTVWSGTSSITGRTLAIGAFGPAFTGGLPCLPPSSTFSRRPARSAVAQGALTASSTQEFFLGASPFVHRFLYNAATQQCNTGSPRQSAPPTPTPSSACSSPPPRPAPTTSSSPGPPRPAPRRRSRSPRRARTSPPASGRWSPQPSRQPALAARHRVGRRDHGPRMGPRHRRVRVRGH